MSSFAVGTATLCGCASVVPSFDIPYQASEKDGAAPNASSIVNRIRCELAEITDDKDDGLIQLTLRKEDVQAIAELSLTVTDDGALAPTLSATQGVFTFGTGVKYDQSREQNFTEELSFSLKSLQGLSQAEACRQLPDTNLAGNLGLRQMWQLADSSGPDSEWSKTGGTGVFGGSISFTVDKELTATGPTWKLAHLTSPGPFLSAYDKNVDKLTFGFVRGPNASKPKGEKAAQDAIAAVKQNQQIDALQTIANSQK